MTDSQPGGEPALVPLLVPGETGERTLVRPEQPGHWERRMVRDLRGSAPGGAGR